MAADLRPVLAEVAGLPDAPARFAQVAGRYTSGMFEFEAGVAVTISGRPPVLRVPLDVFNTLPSATAGSAAQFDQELPLLALRERQATALSPRRAGAIASIRQIVNLPRGCHP